MVFGINCRNISTICAVKPDFTCKLLQLYVYYVIIKGVDMCVNILRKISKDMLSPLMTATLLLTSLVFPGYSAQAAPFNSLTNMMQTMVIQSVTTSINSIAFTDEQEIQTANDGTQIDEQTGDDSQVPDDATPDTSTPNQTPAATSLRPGTSGEDVKRMQLRLTSLDYFEDSDDADGVYGVDTSQAIKLFQRTNGLSIDGIAGETTLSLIYSTKAYKYTIKQGDSGSDVASLQRRLKDLKYFSGSATGYFGSSTTTSLKAFQKMNGLKEDGKAGAQTRDLLYSSKAKKAVTSASTTTPAPSGTTGTKSSSKFLNFAQAQLGKRYVSGNEGPNSFDCSGYVYYCLRNNGINIGRLSAKGYSQVDEWTTVKKSDLQAGDLLFFGLRGSASVGHTGIYIGNGKMIHCSSSQGKVVITSISTTYWVQNYKTAKRVY